MKAHEMIHAACAWLRARQLLLAVFVAAAVLIPRSVVITLAHSPSMDDPYHLYRGTLYLHHDFKTMLQINMDTPPLGEALSAVPAWLNRVEPISPLDKRDDASEDISAAPPTPDRFVLSKIGEVETAIWKVLLFLPAIALIFHWVRSIYSTASAWLAVAMVLVEPTITAHTPLPSIDVLNMEAILFAVWTLWQFIQRPTAMTAILAGFFTAAAMLVKFTAVVLPGIAGILLVIHLWRNRPAWRSHYIGLGLLAVAAVPVSIWVLILCDVENGVPAAVYLHSFSDAMSHIHEGHQAYLLGQYSADGWWYYFPVVATYKIPLGILGLMALGILSYHAIDEKGAIHLFARFRYAETPLLVAGCVWVAALMIQRINIGFRHFLPAEIFLIMLASRCLIVRGRTIAILAWGFLAVAAIDVMRWTPDELSYTNSLHTSPYLDISDSNLDWGQGLKELRHWLDALPNDGRPVYFGYSGTMEQDLYAELGPRLTEFSWAGDWWLPPTGARPADRVTGLMPTHGLLVLSPTALTGQYDDQDRYKMMRMVRPDYLIGHCLLVYDLDALRARGETGWIGAIGLHGPN